MVCSGRGTCQSTSYFATQALDEEGAVGGYTYGASNSAATWDKNAMTGCYCTQQYYGRLAGNNQQPWGYDCSLFQCPKGDNQLTTGQTHETQTIKCLATGGSFTITFRSVTSSPIAYNANAATIQSTVTDMSRWVRRGAARWVVFNQLARLALVPHPW